MERGVPERVDIWGGAFSAEIPDGWNVVELDDVVEIELDDAAVHFSVFRREEESAPVDGEAMWAVEDFAGARTVVVPPTEHPTSEGFVATASYLEPETEGTRRLDVGARISSKRLVFYTYNDDGTRDELRDQARRVFGSLRVD